MGEDPVRVAFVGCGGMSREHLSAWRALHGHGARFQVVAAADPVVALAERHAGAAAEWQGSPVAVHADWRRMLEECRPDAVDVCTPHDLHHAVACGCVEAGADVIVEKPLAVTLRAGRRMLAAARRHGRILATAEQVRRWPGSRALAWAAGGGLLGTPVLASIQFVGGSRRDPDAAGRPGPMPWRLERSRAGGGVAIDIGVHMADLLLYCFGPIRRVTATCAVWADRPFADGRTPDVEDAMQILLEFESGMRCTWAHANVLAGQALHTNAYYGSRGSIVSAGFYPTAPRWQRWDGQETLEPEALVGRCLEALSADQRERLFPAWLCRDPLHPGPGGDLGVRLELAEFLESVRTRRPPEVGGAEGYAAQAVAAAILESGHLGGQPLLVDDVASGRISRYQDPVDEALGLA